MIIGKPSLRFQGGFFIFRGQSPAYLKDVRSCNIGYYVTLISIALFAMTLFEAI